jgi:hypothetical protein
MKARTLLVSGARDMRLLDIQMDYEAPKQGTPDFVQGSNIA